MPPVIISYGDSTKKAIIDSTQELESKLSQLFGFTEPMPEHILQVYDNDVEFFIDVDIGDDMEISKEMRFKLIVYENTGE